MKYILFVMIITASTAPLFGSEDANLSVKKAAERLTVDYCLSKYACKYELRYASLAAGLVWMHNKPLDDLNRALGTNYATGIQAVRELQGSLHCGYQYFYDSKPQCNSKQKVFAREQKQEMQEKPSSRWCCRRNKKIKTH